MRSFDVYANDTGDLKAVKQGWCWPAFFFGWVWALVSGLWTTVGLLLAGWIILNIMAAVYGVFNTAGYSGDAAGPVANGVAFAIFACFIVLKVLPGARGNQWRRSRMERQGFTRVQTVEAEGKPEAMALVRAASAPASSPAFFAAPTARRESPLPSPAKPTARREDREPLNASDNRDSRVGDTFLLIFAALIGLAACLSVVGLLPVGILLLGLVLAIRSGNPSYLRTATGIVSGFGIVVVVLAVLAGVGIVLYQEFQSVDPYGYDAFDTANAVFVCMTAAVVSLVLVLALRFLWLRPLLRQLGALSAVFGGVKIPEIPKRAAPQKIVTRDGLKTYSVADELAKWNALHSDGVIDDGEYQRARDELLKQV